MSCSRTLAGGSTATFSKASSRASNGWPPRGHRDDEPTVGAGKRAVPHCRDESGSDDARFSGAAGTHEGDQFALGTGVTESGQQPLDQPLTPEEPIGVAFFERPEALVRVVDFDRRDRGRCRECPERAPQLLEEGRVQSDIYSLALVADHALRGATGEGERPDSPLVGPAAAVIARATAHNYADRHPDVSVSYSASTRFSEAWNSVRIEPSPAYTTEVSASSPTPGSSRGSIVQAVARRKPTAPRDIQRFMSGP